MKDKIYEAGKETFIFIECTPLIKDLNSDPFDLVIRDPKSIVKEITEFSLKNLLDRINKEYDIVI